MVLVLYIFGNPRSESTSEAGLIADPSFFMKSEELMFFQSNQETEHMGARTRQTEILNNSCVHFASV